MIEHKRNIPAIIRKQIGSTTYILTIYSEQTGKENLTEKVMRIIKNDLQSQPKSDIIKPLQAGWLPERSSYERKQAD